MNPIIVLIVTVGILIAWLAMLYTDELENRREHKRKTRDQMHEYDDALNAAEQDRLDEKRQKLEAKKQTIRTERKNLEQERERLKHQKRTSRNL